MKLLTSIAVVLGLVVLAGILVGSRGDGAEPTANPVSYHQRFVNERAAAGTAGHLMTLPAPQDRASANAMTNAGVAMVEAAASMEDAAAVLLTSGDPGLAEMGNHWTQDARMLDIRGAWMMTTATSDSMVHDPDAAPSINLVNLEANGAVMVAEGTAMIQHGQDMSADIEELRASGALDEAALAKLTTASDLLVATGETAVSDGTRMQDDARLLRQSLAQ